MRVSADHEIPDRSAIKVEPGQRVTVGDRDVEWPAFVFVTTSDGEGWVPEHHLTAERPEAAVVESYDTQELPVSTGDDVELLVDDRSSAWAWCRAADGSEGWIPHRALELDR